MVLALTLTLVLVLTLALAPSGMISKKGVPEFCPSTVVVVVVVVVVVAVVVVVVHPSREIVLKFGSSMGQKSILNHIFDPF